MPTNAPRVFHVETTWKQSFSRRFNMEYLWYACRETTSTQLDSHIQRVCNAYLGRIKEYLRPLPMIELDVKIGNG